ncbi:N-formylglutamate amidohydrolase [Sphingobium sp. DEHP117]|uniref:N-formylglutamate amidohydrolase n=1 Tax=Sphingobium sp. DEHP117 TaxID=2993436 RepID=UPI0027D58B21|nr:N-formylglutamate amidohydrolase [Sphingobium sp. DEHP117]MDQ4419113.1 N-formylglutamate amidohydrolase [Sphingobium sp. DEHP117]
MSFEVRQNQGVPGQIEAEPFVVLGPDQVHGPVLISVPHAGRVYPAEVRAQSAHPHEALALLEDRYADALVTGLEMRGYRVVIAQVARAVIDLNRDPRDIDRRMIAGMPHGQALIETAKSRGGLGLFPRSLPRVGGLWRAPLHWDQARARIASVHAPYHARIEQEMRAIRAACGQALLLDVHSMPPLEAARFGGGMRPDVVIGDRFGASAAARFSEIARGVIARHGLRSALNHPYPGTYIAERHGRPALGRHALQIEISRDLYLDSRLREPGQGLAAIRAMVADLADTLREEAGRDSDFALAAE